MKVVVMLLFIYLFLVYFYYGVASDRRLSLAGRIC